MHVCLLIVIFGGKKRGVLLIVVYICSKKMQLHVLIWIKKLGHLLASF